jgi:hypothetical protein
LWWWLCSIEGTTLVETFRGFVLLGLDRLFKPFALLGLPLTLVKFDLKVVCEFFMFMVAGQSSLESLTGNGLGTVKIIMDMISDIRHWQTVSMTRPGMIRLHACAGIVLEAWYRREQKTRTNGREASKEENRSK